MEEDIRVPLFYVNGFLDSGKTTFLKFTLSQSYFAIEGKTLLILCEEGEEAYDEALLKRTHTEIVTIENEEDLTPEYLMVLDYKYAPDRVLVESNGMWRTSRFEEMRLPEGWGIMQEITIVDASTFQVYMNNMKSMFMEMVRHTEMVIFNRCQKEDPLATFRRGIKVANPSAEVIFEDEHGEIENIFADEMPYDMEAAVIEISPEDYGLWYIDVMDNAERYQDKMVRFKARVRKAKNPQAPFFLPGRVAMTCCADDTTFIGYKCKSKIAPTLSHGEWVEVTARIALENISQDGTADIIMYADTIEPCDALEDEMVYFN